MDPMGFAAGDNDLYGFVDNNPTEQVDPTGLFLVVPVVVAVEVATPFFLADAGIATAATATGVTIVGGSAALGQSIKSASQLDAQDGSQFGNWLYDHIVGSSNNKPSPPAPPLQLHTISKSVPQPPNTSGGSTTQQQQEQNATGPCFTAGTPLRTPWGSLNIENIRAGDLVLSRDEFDPAGMPAAKIVEEVFVNTGLVWHLHVGNNVIRTSADHPFFVIGRGWTTCNELKIGAWFKSS